MTSSPAKAAEAVVSRLLRGRASEFALECIDNKSFADSFELQARGGRVHVRGSSAVALCRGVYHYLRQTGTGMLAWSGSRIELPPRLPDFPRTHVACPYVFRHYLNVCTFGYSTAYWSWERWERELDWMALHGINMPLAHVGQEAIWARVWRDFGITDEELDDHFTGPAHLPWNRMGNINRHDGPLPNSWHLLQVELQHRILARMRELGMEPVAPAFSGFVPRGLKRLAPDCPILELNSWAGFENDCQTFLLSPFSKLFPEIGASFIQKYAEEFGPVRYYLADALNELDMPAPAEGRFQFLARLGEAIINSIDAGDPRGVWVMQGWMFHYNRRLWTRRAVKALLSRVPDDRMIVIDLSNESFAGWRKLSAFFGKSWIYGTVHNFGGNNAPNGDLRFYGKEPAKAARSPRRGNLVGFAICPEGIENNEVVYELLCDVAWSGEPIPLGRWLAGYCRSRYGACPPRMRRAWRLLLSSVYSRAHTTIRHGFQSRPVLQPRGTVHNAMEARQALDAFLSCASSLAESPQFVYDAIELAGHVLGSCVDDRLRDTGLAHEAGFDDWRDLCLEQSMETLRRIDSLLSVHPNLRLTTWLHRARMSATNSAEGDYYARNARRLITTWGGPALSDYAGRMWSGLIRDYYVPRWEAYYEQLRRGLQPDVRPLEEEWILSGRLSSVALPPDPIAEITRLLREVDGWKRVVIPSRHFGERVGDWNPDKITAVPARLEWNVGEFFSEPGAKEVIFRHAAGSHGIHVESVRLIENGDEVSRDGAPGLAGPDNTIYRTTIRLFDRKPGANYVLVAHVRGAGGTDSAGSVWLRPLDMEEVDKQTDPKTLASAR